MSYNVTLSEKCGESDLLPYEDHCERRTRPNTPIEDEMLRHSLEIAKKEGLVDCVSKKEYMTLEA